MLYVDDNDLVIFCLFFWNISFVYDNYEIFYLIYSYNNDHFLIYNFDLDLFDNDDHDVDDLEYFVDDLECFVDDLECFVDDLEYFVDDHHNYFA